MSLEEDYYRDNLLNIINKTNGKPIMVTGRLMCNRNHMNWCTFAEIKPYREGVDSHVLCNHLNFKLSEVEKWAQISALNHGRIFFIIGYPDRYRSAGGMRGCLRLHCPKGLPAIFIWENLVKYRDRLKSCLYELPDYDAQGVFCEDKIL